uniref:G-protein coupled receptors family 1 profile domain-containing protein n=1 Tax=Anopheles culicifacies TaxID=139723 RepID=A0A182LRI2_9DIPT
MIKMMVTVVIVFTICWLPFNFLMLMKLPSSWDLLPYFWFAFHWLAMSHSCYNPIIYCYMNARFRSGFILVLHGVPGVPQTFSIQDMITYIMCQLHLKREYMERVHFRPSSRTMSIDVKDQSIAVKVVSEYDPKQTLMIDGNTYLVPVSMNDGSIIVKLHDLSMSVTDRNIVQHMSRYGTVISVSEGRWPSKSPLSGLLNGNRCVRMTASELIPSHMEVDGEQTFVTYHGQVPKWRNPQENPRPPVAKPDNHDWLAPPPPLTMDRLAYAYASSAPESSHATSSASKPYDPRLRSACTETPSEDEMRDQLQRRKFTVVPSPTETHSEAMKRQAEKMMFEHLKRRTE